MTNVPLKIDTPNKILTVEISSLVSAFLSGRKQTTINAYNQDLTDFMGFTNSNTINESISSLLSLDQGNANLTILNFKNYLITKNLSSATINRRLAAIRSLTQLARTLGIVTYNIEIENQPSTPYRNTSGLGIDAVNTIVNYLTGKTDSKSVRDLAIVRLLFDLGLRRQEICNIDYEDICFKTSAVKILGKGQFEKSALNLPVTTLAALKNWISIRGNHSGALFFRLDKASNNSLVRLTGSGLYNIITELGTKLKIDDVSVHGFRHTSITECAKVIAENNLGLESLVKFSRHKSITTAFIYMDHLEGKQKTLSDLVSKKV